MLGLGFVAFGGCVTVGGVFWFSGMADTLINLMDLDPDALKDFAVAHGEKPFRATQLLKWIYQWGVVDFDEMTLENVKV